MFIAVVLKNTGGMLEPHVQTIGSSIYKNNRRPLQKVSQSCRLLWTDLRCRTIHFDPCRLGAFWMRSMVQRQIQ